MSASPPLLSVATAVVLALVMGCQPLGSEADRPASSVVNVHETLFEGSLYPSAAECGACHKEHYREWSVSPHAYAQISPVFNAMQGTIGKLNNGTFGDFCIRCHTPVGMALGEPVFAPSSERHPVSLEGVTCIACHRVDKAYGKNTGRGGLLAGDIFEPVYGPRDNSELTRILQSPDEYRSLVTEPGKIGRKIHADAHRFFAITTPGFCGRCHDVTFVDGFRLEEAFSEYKQSPAAERGETCQDCHMGTVPGVASGYATGPAAVIGRESSQPAKRTNHMFVGPDYSVVHPGIFPHNPEAKALASFEDWVLFDWQAGWGTDEFEGAVADEDVFPEPWSWADDRYEARDIIIDQLALLAEAREQGTTLLRNGYQLGEVIVDRADSTGLEFSIDVANGTDGHNVPTGFVAERLVFLRVTVTDTTGAVLFESGDLDPNGDVRDLHSLYVHNGERPLDEQLFSLQSRFLTRNVRGGEREQVLAVNYSLDPLPFARPSTRASILWGRPSGARIHKQAIEPGGRRRARYEVPASELSGQGPYEVEVQLVAGMVPVNLVHAIKDVGFDFGMSPRDVADAVVAGHRVLWKRTASIEVR